MGFSFIENQQSIVFIENEQPSGESEQENILENIVDSFDQSIISD